MIPLKGNSDEQELYSNFSLYPFTFQQRFDFSLKHNLPFCSPHLAFSQICYIQVNFVSIWMIISNPFKNAGKHEKTKNGLKNAFIVKIIAFIDLLTQPLPNYGTCHYY